MKEGKEKKQVREFLKRITDSSADVKFVFPPRGSTLFGGNCLTDFDKILCMNNNHVIIVYWETG